jgi:hypothetical protein
MRTLDEITRAARVDGDVTPEELRRAVVAFDVLISQLDLPRSPEMLAQYFKAAAHDPIAYAGWANSSDNPEFIYWYTRMNEACKFSN